MRAYSAVCERPDGKERTGASVFRAKGRHTAWSLCLLYLSPWKRALDRRCMQRFHVLVLEHDACPAYCTAGKEAAAAGLVATVGQMRFAHHTLQFKGCFLTCGREDDKALVISSQSAAATEAMPIMLFWILQA